MSNRNISTRRILSAILTILALFFTVAQLHAEEGAGHPVNEPFKIGVIRWDAWVGNVAGIPNFMHGVFNERVLSDPQWFDRVPFYGSIDDKGDVKARCVNQECLDQEIRYAAGVIDYWTFLYFPEQPKYAAPMNTALKLFISSKIKDQVGFCLMLDEHILNGQADVWLRYLKESSYQRVFVDRPLIYVFANTLKPPDLDERCPVITRELAALTKGSIDQGTGRPYYVILNPIPEIAAEICARVGGDAISTYAYAPQPPKSTEIDRSYQALVNSVEARWEQYRNTGTNVIPFCMTGWDGRPRRAQPFLNKWANWYENWYQHGTPTEIAAHIVNAATWNAHHGHKTPNHVLVYAWNEFSEGGWLCPTLQEKNVRLEALRKERKRFLNKTAEQSAQRDASPHMR